MNAEVTQATLNIYAGPYLNGNTTIHVVRSSAGIPITADDFDEVTFEPGGTVTTPSANTWLSVNLEPAALNWVIKGGMTKLALVHDLDLDDSAPFGINDVLVGLGECPDCRPYLVVTYSVP